MERALFAEGVRHGPARTSVRTREGKLIENEAETRELYLAGDRGERSDVADRESALVSSLAELLAAHRARAASAPPGNDIAPLDERLQKQLQALGYAEE
jgi:hypothetical protein